MASKAQAEKFLDEAATALYELRNKYGIAQEDLILTIQVRIDSVVVRPESFKNVCRQ